MMMESKEFKEPKPEYCVELKEIWSQFDDKIKWTSPSYKTGYVRLGDINLARISFWTEKHSGITIDNKRYVGRNVEGADEEGYVSYTELQIADDLRKKTYYWGINIEILSIITGEQVWRNYQIDFGGEAYLHKKNWTWHTEDGADSEVDVTDMIKKIGRAMLWIEVWCS